MARFLGIGSLAAALTLLGGTATATADSVATAEAANVPARIGTATALPAGAVILGGLAASTPLSVTVTLAPRSAAALARFASQVSSPTSAEYRHYLSTAQFAAQFGASSAQVDSVESYLRSEGLHPSAATANHLSIPVTGTASAFASAFSTSFDRVAVNGRTAYSNTTAPALPSSIASSVEGIIGLDSVYLPTRIGLDTSERGSRTSRSPHITTGGPQPCAAAKTAGSADDAYTADQLASAYDFSSLYGANDEGAGQIIALYELEPNKESDITAFQKCYGTSAKVSYVDVNGGDGSGYGSGEAALDIEDVIGFAPQADIRVYKGPNTNAGAYDVYSDIISQDKAHVVSTSWGECETALGSSAAKSENTLFEEAATQGQSIFAAAGDDGSEDCGANGLSVDDPAAQPYVTGVGGTTLSTVGPPPTQTVWNEAAKSAGAGGGGISKLWTMPSYQSGAASSVDVINSASSKTPCGAAKGSYCREVPDVSADADPYTGFTIYYDGAWTGIGGTSAAAPLWAAFTALVNASSSCGGTDIGFANPDLYTAAASNYSANFSDITSGDNDYTGTHDGEFAAGTHYDMASGLGTPIGSSLPAALCGSTSTTNTVTVTNPGSQTGTVGTAVSLQISASDSASAQTLTYTATGLPTGLSISSTSGLISGTPTTAATSSVTVTATDTTGASGSATFTFAVAAATGNTVTVTNPGSQTGTVGTAVSLQISASDSASAQTLTYSATGLPTGLSISSTSGVISGTPTTAATSSVTVTATDTTGASGSASFTFTVKAATTNTVTVTNPGSQTGTVGTAVSLQISASDSASAQTLTYTATGLPTGLSISSTSGLISGTPTTAATSSVTVTATDTTGASGAATFTFTIGASTAGTLTLIDEPDAGMTQIYNLITSATKSVDLTMYALEDTTAEQDLVADAARGVDVRVILDQNLEKSNNTAAYNYLSENGVHVVWADPTFAATHEKCMVVDDKTALIMSLNFQTQYYSTTRDFAVIDTNAADVAAIEAVFNGDYAQSPITATDGTDLVWSPGSEDQLLAVINAATSTLSIENEEMGSSAVTDAIVAAAKRGVNVEVTMTANSEYDSDFTSIVNAGGHVHLYPDTTTGYYIHAKVIVADAGLSDQQSYVGSINFSTASMTENRELGIITTNASIVSGLSSALASDYAGASAYSATNRTAPAARFVPGSVPAKAMSSARIMRAWRAVETWMSWSSREA